MVAPNVENCQFRDLVKSLLSLVRARDQRKCIRAANRCPSTARVFCCSPARFARFTGDFRSAALNFSCDITRTVVASTCASFRAIRRQRFERYLLPMHPEALALQDRLLKAMSPERKLLVSEALRNSAWELKAAWIRSRNPDLSPLEVQQRVRQIFLDVGA